MRFKKNTLIGPDVVAVVVDMRSSSQMLDDLVASGSPMGPYIDLVAEMKHTIAPYTMHHICNPYKFTGDGWIVLFDANTGGAVLFDFVRALGACYARHSPRLLGCLTTPPDLPGLTFGIDSGSIKKLTIYQQTEYIGRTIVIASRLQSAARQCPDNYAAYISNPCFEHYFAGIPGLESNDESVSLGSGARVVAVPCKRIRVPINTEPPPDGLRQSAGTGRVNALPG